MTLRSGKLQKPTWSSSLARLKSLAVRRMSMTVSGLTSLASSLPASLVRPGSRNMSAVCSSSATTSSVTSHVFVYTKVTTQLNTDNRQIISSSPAIR